MLIDVNPLDEDLSGSAVLIHSEMASKSRLVRMISRTFGSLMLSNVT